MSTRFDVFLLTNNAMAKNAPIDYDLLRSLKQKSGGCEKKIKRLQRGLDLCHFERVRDYFEEIAKMKIYI